MNRRTFLQSLAAAPLAANTNRTKLTVVLDSRVGKISRHLYGHFAEHLGGCVYDGMWVGPESKVANIGGLRKDTIDCLKRIKAPMIRWPGGCFADEYHWRDGIGPRASRPKRWNYSWNRDEDNAFGTDEFLAYCNASGSAPFLCLNVGSGTVQEATEWVEYCNTKHPVALSELRGRNGHPEPYGVRYWSIGNENWACGGSFDAEDYARHYARYTTSIRRVGRDQPMEFVACGDFRGDWNQKFFETLARRPLANGKVQAVNHLSIHHYFRRGEGLRFSDEDYYALLGDITTMETNIRKALAVIDQFSVAGPPIGIALDEWGVWHDPPKNPPSALFQNNTMRDAILAAAVFNSLNGFGKRVSIGSIAQTFNVLQCMAFTRGKEFVLTPTYHVFDLYQPHMDAQALKTENDGPVFTSKLRDGVQTKRPYLSASASEAGGKVFLTLVNQHLTEPAEVEIRIVGGDGPSVKSATLKHFSSPDVRNENNFESPSAVPVPVDQPVSMRGNKFVHVVPPHSVQALHLTL